MAALHPSKALSNCHPTIMIVCSTDHPPSPRRRFLFTTPPGVIHTSTSFFSERKSIGRITQHTITATSQCNLCDGGCESIKRALHIGLPHVAIEVDAPSSAAVRERTIINTHYLQHVTDHMTSTRSSLLPACSKVPALLPQTSVAVDWPD